MKEFFDRANESVAAINRKLIDITQKNLNLGLDLAKSLAGARNPFEVAQLLASYWRKQFDELTAQLEEVRKRLFGFSAAEFKTREPFPESGLQETAQDPTSARLKLNSDTQSVQSPPFAPGTTGSEVRAPKERQPRSRKRGTAKQKSTSLRRPKSTSRAPAQRVGQKLQATKTKAKARSSSAAVARQIARPDRERQSRTQKKGAPKEPDLRNLSSDIKFGLLDGNPVRFTNLEAWWLVDGAWQPIPTGEVLSNAAVMREVRFKRLFPQVPLLPSKAFQSGKR
jgi:Phasin protein